MRVETTEKITQAAAELFLRHSYAAVSVDAIAERAGCTKVTVYQHFDSKERLLIEVLQWRLERRERELDTALQATGKGAVGVLALFEWMAVRTGGAEFPGCAFLKAAQEVGDAIGSVRGLVLEAKQLLRKRILGLLAGTGAEDPERTADALALLLEGAQSLSFIEHDSRPFVAARAAAAHLLGIEDGTRSARARRKRH